MLRPKKLIKEIARWIFWYPFRVVAQNLPFKCSYLVATVQGKVSYFIGKSKRMMMAEELDILFGDDASSEQKKEIIRDAFLIIAKDKIEQLLFPKIDEGNIDRIITIEGKERLEAALTHKRGVVVLLSHFGQNRLIMAGLGYRGYKVNQVAAPATVWESLVDQRLVSPLMKKTLKIELEHERSLPAKFIYYDSSLKDAFIALKNNEIVIIAVDAGGGENKARVKFLGRQANLSVGGLKLAHRTGAVALPMFVRRNADSSHTLIIEKQIALDLKKGESDYGNEMQELAEVFEQYVRKYPAHYLKHLLMLRERSDLDEEPFFSRSEDSS